MEEIKIKNVGCTELNSEPFLLFTETVKRVRGKHALKYLPTMRADLCILCGDRNLQNTFTWRPVAA